MAITEISELLGENFQNFLSDIQAKDSIDVIHLNMQTRIELDQICIGGINRKQKHFYILKGAQRFVRLETIEELGFKPVTTSSGHSFWRGSFDEKIKFIQFVSDLINSGKDAIFLEIERRNSLFKQLMNPENCTPQELRDLRLYGGQQGIWKDTSLTADISKDNDGIAISVLHLGKSYDNDLSDEGLIYHYPATNRPAGRDQSEINSLRNCFKFDVPVFVISKQPNQRRKIQLGYVAELDDKNNQCLILFDRQVIQTEQYEPPFSLDADRKQKQTSVEARERDPRFRFKVFKRCGSNCAVCSMTVTELLEAAHIKAVHKGGSDDPRNGLVLCRNHHRALDEYLFSINPVTLEIATKDNLRTSTLSETLTRRTISSDIAPEKEALEWHWQEFRKYSEH